MTVTALAREASLRYVSMFPLCEVLAEELATAVARSALPLEQRDIAVQHSTDDLYDPIVRIFVSQAVAHFTVGEHYALMPFYGSPDGRSVLQKIPSFTRDVQREITAVVEAGLGDLEGRRS